MNDPKHKARRFADLTDIAEKLHRIEKGNLTTEGANEYLCEAVETLDHAAWWEVVRLVTKHIDKQLATAERLLASALSKQEA